MVEKMAEDCRTKKTREQKRNGKQRPTSRADDSQNNKNECVNAASWLAERAAVRRARAKEMEEEEEE